MKNLIIKALEFAADNKILCNVRSVNKVFDTYDDNNGQRQCYIQYMGFDDSDKDKSRFKDCFYIRRHCTFFNKVDEGKQGAILLAVYPDKLQDSDKCRVWNNGVEFAGFEFIFHKDICFN